jgi:hypothetical protein
MARSHAGGIKTAAQQASRHPEGVMIEQGAFELDLRGLFVGRAGKQDSALEQDQPGGSLEEIRAQLHVGLPGLLYIGEVLPRDLGHRQVVERVLIAAHEREQQVEWSVELHEVARERQGNHGAGSSLPCIGSWPGSWAESRTGSAASRAANAS